MFYQKAIKNLSNILLENIKKLADFLHLQNLSEDASWLATLQKIKDVEKLFQKIREGVNKD